MVKAHNTRLKKLIKVFLENIWGFFTGLFPLRPFPFRPLTLTQYKLTGWLTQTKTIRGRNGKGRTGKAPFTSTPTANHNFLLRIKLQFFPSNRTYAYQKEINHKHQSHGWCLSYGTILHAIIANLAGSERKSWTYISSYITTFSVVLYWFEYIRNTQILPYLPLVSWIIWWEKSVPLFFRDLVPLIMNSHIMIIDKYFGTLLAQWTILGDFCCSVGGNRSPYRSKPTLSKRVTHSIT